MLKSIESRSADRPDNEGLNQAELASQKYEQRECMPIAVSVHEFCRLTSLGLTKAWELIGSRQVAVRRIGRRTLVLTKSIIALMEDGVEGGTDR